MAAIEFSTSLPLIFGSLVALATLLVWQAFAPARSVGGIATRLDNYVQRDDVVIANELGQPLYQRALIPILRRLLRTLGIFMPKRSYQLIAKQLIYAGEPGGLTALDFMGLRLLVGLIISGGYIYLYRWNTLNTQALGVSLALLMSGTILPSLWLRRRVRRRQTEIQRALPDALDMMTIGVEAGLAFESALLKVGEQWDNVLSREFSRVVTDMRLGGQRNEALQRMVARTGVDELSTFVAVLVQSNQMGISISQVLQSQADQMRIKRRQRAEELARQASVKIVVVLVFFIFPALFIVLLGPSVPRILETLDMMAGRASN